MSLVINPFDGMIFDGFTNIYADSAGAQYASWPYETREAAQKAARSSGKRPLYRIRTKPKGPVFRIELVQLGEPA